MAVGVRSNLRDGTYTATYRVISADGHPVSGGFVFSIGAAGAAPKFTVEQLTQKAAASRPIRYAFDVARGLEYLALAVVIGGLMFLFGLWFAALRSTATADAAWEAASEAFLRRTKRVLYAGIGLGIAAGLAGILLQGATAAGVSVPSAARPSIVRDVVTTSFGTIWALRVGVWLLLFLVIATALRRRAPVLGPQPSRPRDRRWACVSTICRSSRSGSPRSASSSFLPRSPGMRMPRARRPCCCP